MPRKIERKLRKKRSIPKFFFIHFYFLAIKLRWEFIKRQQESKKTRPRPRKRSIKQELDQENKNSPKKATKKKEKNLLFLDPDDVTFCRSD